MPFIQANMENENAKFEKLLENPENRKWNDLFEKEYELKKALAEARKTQQITQEALSKRTGLSQQAISRIENVNDTKGFTFRTLFKYLEGIGYEIQLHPMTKQK